MHPVLTDLINNTQYGFHCVIVAAVLTSAVLVYVFGFKSAVEPPFDKLSYPGAEERKPAAGKKKKPKDKKTQSNGHVTSVGDTKKSSEQKSSNKKEDKLEKSPSKESGKNAEKKSPAKNALRETKGSNKDVKKSTGGDSTGKARQQGKGKENVEQVKNKKNHVEEKPKDFDDGEWEQALSRKDKKNRKATLDEIISKDKKKDGKKKNKGGDDSGLMDSSGDSDARASEEKSQVLEALAEIGLSSTEVESAPVVVEASKPKKTKKKKPTEQPQPPSTSSSPPEEKAQEKTEEKKSQDVEDAPPPSSIVTETLVPPEPKPQRSAKKQETLPSTKTEETVVEPSVTGTADAAAAATASVAFDELGDAWKEAKVPKKATKKKSRKD